MSVLEMEKEKRAAEALAEWKRQATGIESALRGFGTETIVLGWISMIACFLVGLVTIEDGTGFVFILSGICSFIVLCMAGYAAKALPNIAACVRAIWERET